MLEAEADGLRAIGATATIRVPAPVAVGLEGDFGYLVVDWLDLSAPAGSSALGAALAAMHRSHPPAGPHGERYGWTRDNFLGATRQVNGWDDDWATFFVERRLAPQFALAAVNGHDVQRRGERVLQRSRELLRGRDVVPSLVHGDLWSGNAGSLPDGTPVVFDPAAYVGDREVDIAMTELFGGFGGAFVRAYADAWPLDGGYPQRRTIYNLYHLLNHLHLFGARYAARVERSIDAILAAR
jgi:fructosamine-3-kinase